jgi:hypothetical protein
MKIRSRSLGLSCVLLAACAGAAAQGDAGKAADRCEAAVTETIQKLRGKDAQDIQFIGAKRAVAANDDDEIGVKGEGRYRGAGGAGVPFSYSCAFNSKSGATSGVVFRETGGGKPAGADKPWQPDLTNVSPADCEAAAAAALKEKYPRVDAISFSSATRQVKPAPEGRLSLEGQGLMERAPGMRAAPFRYRCEIEPRSGKIVRAQAID